MEPSPIVIILGPSWPASSRACRASASASPRWRSGPGRWSCARRGLLAVAVHSPARCSPPSPCGAASMRWPRPFSSAGSPPCRSGCCCRGRTCRCFAPVRADCSSPWCPLMLLARACRNHAGGRVGDAASGIAGGVMGGLGGFTGAVPTCGARCAVSDKDGQRAIIQNFNLAMLSVTFVAYRLRVRHAGDAALPSLAAVAGAVAGVDRHARLHRHQRSRPSGASCCCC